MDNQTSHISLGFKLTPEIHRDILDLFACISADANQAGLSARAANSLSSLLTLAIDQFYFDIMKEVRVHPAAKRSADKGVSTVIKGAKLVIRKMVNSLEPHELLIFSDYMQTLLREKQGEHYIAFYLNHSMSEEIQALIERIRTDEHTQAYNHDIAALLCSITDLAVINFYSKPTQLFKVRPFIKKSADLGIKTVNKGIHFVIHQLFKKTRQKELIAFSHILEKHLVDDNESYLLATQSA